MVSRDGGFLTHMPVPDILPAWLSKADLDFYVGEFTRTGFRGGLNWYRNIDRSWELLAPFVQAKVTVPALYMAGDCDLVVLSATWTRRLPTWRRTCRNCAARSFFRAAAIGLNRNVQPRSAPR